FGKGVVGEGSSEAVVSGRGSVVAHPSNGGGLPGHRSRGRSTVALVAGYALDGPTHFAGRGLASQGLDVPEDAPRGHSVALPSRTAARASATSTRHPPNSTMGVPFTGHFPDREGRVIP